MELKCRGAKSGEPKKNNGLKRYTTSKMPVDMHQHAGIAYNRMDLHMHVLEPSINIDGPWWYLRVSIATFPYIPYVSLI